MLRINHNIPSLVTRASLARTQRGAAKTMEKLATGLRINRASDDAAGLSISENLRTQSRGLNMGNRNISDGISMLNIAEGAMNEIDSILQRLRELAIQSANDTLGSNDRIYTNQEAVQLVEEVDRITRSTTFNTMSLLDGASIWGSPQGGILHIGPNAEADANEIVVYIPSLSAPAIGIDNVDLTQGARAVESINFIDNALKSVNTVRADLGAKVNRLEHAQNNQINSLVNTTAAESMIRDADFASETSAMTKFQILQQSATAMLTQANSSPNSVLSLIQ